MEKRIAVISKLSQAGEVIERQFKQVDDTVRVSSFTSMEHLYQEVRKYQLEAFDTILVVYGKTIASVMDLKEDIDLLSEYTMQTLITKVYLLLPAVLLKEHLDLLRYFRERLNKIMAVDIHMTQQTNRTYRDLLELRVEDLRERYGVKQTPSPNLPNDTTPVNNGRTSSTTLSNEEKVSTNTLTFDVDQSEPLKGGEVVQEQGVELQDLPAMSIGYEKGYGIFGEMKEGGLFGKSKKAKALGVLSQQNNQVSHQLLKELSLE